jgi:hypothetical protein
MPQTRKPVLKNDSQICGAFPMKKNSLLVALTVCVVLPVSQLSMAGDSEISAMADIVINLNHFPSDVDKEKLAGIIASGDSSEAEVAIASAISNIAHQANASDRENLSAIAADESVSSELRDLATAVLNVNHKASAADIAKLEMIASES